MVIYNVISLYVIIHNYELKNGFKFGGNMRVAVIDGQGGGIGKAIVEKWSEFNEDIYIIALEQIPLQQL